MDKIKKRFVVSISPTSTSALFLAIAPILDPYIVAEIGSSITIRINDVLAMMVAFYVGAQGIKCKKKNGILFPLCMLSIMMSVCSILTSPSVNMANQIKVLLIWTMYSMLMMIIWSGNGLDRFFQVAEKIGYVVVAILILQFILGNQGLPVWDGRMPFQLSKYDSWAGYIDPNTADIRPNSIFQEPSYVGIYLIPLFAYSLLKGKTKKVILFAAGLLLTSSLVAVLSAVVVTAYYFVFSSRSKIQKKMKRRIIIATVIGTIILVVLCNLNDDIQSLIGYIIRRVRSIGVDIKAERMGSAKVRLLGNLYLFDSYSFSQKLFGLGTLRYAVIYNVISYSNNFVNIFLYYGLVGFSGFIFWLVYFKRILINRDNSVFFVLMLLVFVADQQWFSWYFFYLITCCIATSSTENKITGALNCV